MKMFALNGKMIRIFLLLSCVSFSFLYAQEKDMAFYTANAPFKMPTVVVPSFPGKSVSITDFGAVNDGKTSNTQAFEKAINTVSAGGGGRVVVPKGIWLTGPIQMRSNIDLHVEKDATILFTPDRSQYPLIKPSSNSKNNYIVMPPVYGIGLENVAITGEGILDGSGEAWRPLKKSKADNALWNKFLSSGGVLSNDGKIWWPSRDAMYGEEYLKRLKGKDNLTEKDFLPARDFLRPKMIVFVDCKNVLYEGVTFRNSPNFVVNPQRCTNLTIRNVHVFNEWWAQNGDGIDVSACKNVMIYKTVVSAGDDGICMKSSGGKNDEAELQNVVIANCTVLRAHGGFVIGSNTDGGMKNIYVTDCKFIGTDIGVRVKSNAGRGGLVKDIYIENIEMANIINEAVLFDTYYEDVPAGKEKNDVKTTITDKVPEFTKFYLKNIVCKSAARAFKITGLPQMPIHDIYFENMSITANEGFVAKDANDIFLKKVTINAPEPLYTTNNCKNIKVED
jgi:polygalacturonase